MMMPIMSGVEVCRYVKEHSNIPVILMSSGTTDASDIGHDAFIAKPFDLASLESLIEAVLQRTVPTDQ
jgi:DNA-binding response OmpR family regulator